MENFEELDPSEIENQQSLKKFEEIAPQKFDLAQQAASESNRDQFFSTLEILNDGNMPPAEGLYEQVHFRCTGPQTLSAKVFENGRISFSGSWNE